MMKTVSEIFSDGTRATLFGRFYEGIVSRWLEEKRGYKLARHSSGAVHKPRIYWNKIQWDKFDYSGEELFNPKIEDLRKRSYCIPDGCFVNEGKFYIWEAKNWPRYPEKGPKPQIWAYLSSYPWILATTFDLGDKEQDIAGFLFSFWDMPAPIKDEIEQGVNRIIGANKFEIVLTSPIIYDCIRRQYDWYAEITRRERRNVNNFFDQLAGKG